MCVYLRIHVYVWMCMYVCVYGKINNMWIYCVGESRLREIFIKTDNDIKGRYFAEIIRVSQCDYST